MRQMVFGNTHGGRGRRLAASNVLLALLADDVLDGDPDDGDYNN